MVGETQGSVGSGQRVGSMSLMLVGSSVLAEHVCFSSLALGLPVIRQESSAGDLCVSSWTVHFMSLCGSLLLLSVHSQTITLS